MTQLIPAVENNRIEHGILIDLTLQSGTESAITYYISNCYTAVTYNGNLYQPLGGFLHIGDLQQDIHSSNNEITLGLSAIPPEYITAILGSQIKGGAVKIYRAFFEHDTQQIQNINGQDQIFQRFNGYITNYNVSEEVNANVTGGEVSHIITVSASSINGILEKRVAGRRTNRDSYQYRYGDRLFSISGSNIVLGTQVLSAAVETDPSMNKVETLHNAVFDFGKKPTASPGKGATSTPVGETDNTGSFNTSDGW